MLNIKQIELLQQENAQLKEEISILREKIIQLTSLVLDKTWEPPLELGLTTLEAKLLGILVTRGNLCSTELLLHLMYSDKLEVPEMKIIDVYICKIRRKLKPFNLQIDTVWGRGYCLTPSSVLTLRNWGKTEEQTQPADEAIPKADVL